MIEHDNTAKQYEVPLVALADAHSLWDQGHEGKITVIDTTVIPPVTRMLYRLASGEVIVYVPLAPSWNN